MRVVGVPKHTQVEGNEKSSSAAVADGFEPYLPDTCTQNTVFSSMDSAS